jgi:hypothetical protein
MGVSLTLVTLVLAMLITLTIQDPSQVPTCTFDCPPTDLVGRPLQAHSESSSELFCRFQSVPNDFFCKYFLVSFLFLLSSPPHVAVALESISLASEDALNDFH